MDSAQLAAAINDQLESRGFEFVFGAELLRIPGATVSIAGQIDGHPVRFDFQGPNNVADRAHVVWAFDLRTKMQIADASDPVGFPAALSRVDWTNFVGALMN